MIYKMKKVLFAFASLIALAACGNKQTAAPETESSEVKNEVVTNDTISPEMKEANMQEVQAYLKECGAFFIATADGDQPHVRPFGVSEIIDGRLYIMTGKVKDVYKQGTDYLTIQNIRSLRCRRKFADSMHISIKTGHHLLEK